jgi:hypothetical protein
MNKGSTQHFVKVMAGELLNIKVCNSLKLPGGLTGNHHAICHYAYNLPLATIVGGSATDSYLVYISIKA